jgi:phage terminase large subunit-like protein
MMNRLSDVTDGGLPDYIAAAIKSGPVPRDLEGWRTKPVGQLTDGEKVLRFAQDYLVFPEGKMIGKPLVLDPFQCAFVLASFDGSGGHINKAILSMARRNGKSLTIAVILLAYIVGPLRREATLVRGAAMTREQSGLMYRLMALILQTSPRMKGLYRVVPSSKKIVGLKANVEYQSLSRDAKSGYGMAIYVLVVDECGAIDAPNDEFLDMLFSSMGTYSDSKTFLISTQAPSDAAFFSQEIDTATRETLPNVVCHLYTSESEDLFDREGWLQANPALRGGYRSLEDIERNAKDASLIPAKANGFLNLFCNRRVSLRNNFIAPQIWRDNSGPVDMDVFRRAPMVTLGIDLSRINDLSAAVIAAKDEEENIHVKCYAFTPLDNVEARERRDRIPLQQWIKDGHIYAPPGKTLDYDMIAAWLREELDREEIRIDGIYFDRYKAKEFFAACDRESFATGAQRVEVGQGFLGMSGRIQAFETALLQGKIRHGGNQVILNMGAATAVVVSDPAGNRKLTREHLNAGPKIDGTIACIMAIHEHVARLETLGADISWWIT